MSQEPRPVRVDESSEIRFTQIFLRTVACFDLKFNVARLSVGNCSTFASRSCSSSNDSFSPGNLFFNVFSERVFIQHHVSEGFIYSNIVSTVFDPNQRVIKRANQVSIQLFQITKTVAAFNSALLELLKSQTRG